jgi:hypothetical protein
MKMRKGQTAMEYLMTYGWAILIIMVVMAVLFYLGVLNPPVPEQCVFPAGITCISSKLNTTGALTLVIGQGTGHPITVTGVNCTMNSSATWASDNQASLVYSPAAYNVSITSGGQANVATINGTGGLGNVTCRDANNAAVTGGAGTIFNGRIYIRYTETDTTITRTVTGTFSKRYEI